ncbi:hypothetical protein AB0D49_07385 [Streptomyces sp. NPDC048290]|uniref:hypothetical protein n=1 Tax=Streptomyces sp. NPDC048290 TaxID=3155811 RepID=UPI00342D293A
MNPRLLALAGLAVSAVVLPLAVASAGPAGGTSTGRAGSTAGTAASPTGRDGSDGTDRTAPDSPGSPGSLGSLDSPFSQGSPDGDSAGAASQPSPRVSGSATPLTLGLATAARCGPELTSPEGIEAQTCVLTQGEDTWARTYYRNATGAPLTAVLTLMGPGGRTVTLHCPVGAEDEPAHCSTPRERTRAEPAQYTAVAEFADAAGAGPSLLRAGSNSTPANWDPSTGS